MLIVAALNLPFTATFVSDEQQAALEEQYNSMQAQQSLVDKDTETQEPEQEVPFDFVVEDSEADSVVNSEKGNSLKGSSASTTTTSTTTTTTSTTTTTNATTSNTPKSPVERPQFVGILPGKDSIARYRRDKVKTTGLPSYTLARSGSPGDYDTQLESDTLARVAKQEQKQHPRSRKNSNASLMIRAAAGISEPQPFNIVPFSGSNRGLFNALDSAVEKGVISDYQSVGLMSMSSDSLTPEGQQIISDALLKFNCHVVHATDKERTGHYANYCKEFLWPTFHCMTPDIPRNKAYEDQSFGFYAKINQLVADKIVEVYKPGDVVWVNDYHLMCVPQMVREKLPKASIGFFLHVAFPSSEVFRSLAYRAELLSGVLASNLIGFHINEYVQHFKMSLARILAVDITGVGVVETRDHDAFLTALPLGIDTNRLQRILSLDAVQEHRKVIRQRWPSQFLIAARDKADPIRGLPQKLRAFDRFLMENPQWANKVVLVQICSSGYGGSGIDAIADKINSKYGDIASGVQPVVLLKQDIKYEQYLALLSEANGFCVTCLRDGMNLTCHEYAEANSESRMGPLILSEFTGSASVLKSSAIIVNPWDMDQLVQAFKYCVEMPRWERESKFNELKKAVRKHTALEFATNFVKQIMEAQQDEQTRTCAVPDVLKLQEMYTNAKFKRLFLLEAEGPSTVEADKWLQEEAGAELQVSYQHREKDKRRPYYSTRLPLAIRELCADPQNVVYVISPETEDYLERMFRQLPGIGLISEYGRSIRESGSENWTQLSQSNELIWQDQIMPFIKQLKERGVIRKTAIHPSSISIEFTTNIENFGESREHNIIGEYLSLVNDQCAGKQTIRTKLEGNTVTVYRTSLGRLRQRAFKHIVDQLGSDLSFTFMANQPYSSDSEDILYDYAKELKANGVDVVTVSVGKHPSLAMWMVEGTNALLNLLHVMRTGDDVPTTRRLKTNERANERTSAASE